MSFGGIGQPAEVGKLEWKIKWPVKITSLAIWFLVTLFERNGSARSGSSTHAQPLMYFKGFTGVSWTRIS